MIYLISYKHKRKIDSLKHLRYRFFDELTRLVTKGEYTHSEIAIELGNGLFECYSSSVRDKGVRKKIMKLDASRWDFVKLNITEQLVRDYFKRTKNLKYDFFGAAGIILLLPENRNKLFCSEFCYNAIFNSDAGWRFSPSQLREICKNL